MKNFTQPTHPKEKQEMYIASFIPKVSSLFYVILGWGARHGLQFCHETLMVAVNVSNLLAKLKEAVIMKMPSIFIRFSELFKLWNIPLQDYFFKLQHKPLWFSPSQNKIYITYQISMENIYSIIKLKAGLYFQRLITRKQN